MKLPRFTLRDLFWLILVVGLILTIFVRERQTIGLEEHYQRMENVGGGWRWCCETIAKELEERTGIRSLGTGERVVMQHPDGTVALKFQGQNLWEIQKQTKRPSPSLPQ